MHLQVKLWKGVPESVYDWKVTIPVSTALTHYSTALISFIKLSGFLLAALQSNARAVASTQDVAASLLLACTCTVRVIVLSPVACVGTSGCSGALSAFPGC